MIKLFYRTKDGKLVPTTCEEVAKRKAPVHRGREDDADRLDGRAESAAQRDLNNGMVFQKDVNSIMVRAFKSAGYEAPDKNVAMCVTDPEEVDSTADIEIFLPENKRRIFIEIQTAGGWFDYRSKNSTYQRVVAELETRASSVSAEIRNQAVRAYDCLSNIEAMADPVGIHIKGLKIESLASKGEIYLLQQVGQDTFVVDVKDIADAPRSPMPWPKKDLNRFLPRGYLKGQPSLRSFIDKIFPKKVYNR